jgi:(E)-4-hydroxy-3-methylbut-2-enyl-diphosphate synthase
LYICSYNIPLVADIHFAPSVALRVSECFDKIRVNPGNFGKPQGPSSIFLLVMNAAILNSLRWFIAADRRAQFEKLEYTDDDYQKELEHIEKVRPFLYQNDHP